MRLPSYCVISIYALKIIIGGMFYTLNIDLIHIHIYSMNEYHLIMLIYVLSFRWRAYLTSGFTSFYLFVYCIHYFMTKLTITGTISTLLYFGYTLIMVFLFFLLTGTVGFFACFWFVRKIYSVVKVD